MVWLETGEALNHRTEERSGVPSGQPAWGGGCDRVEPSDRQETEIRNPTRLRDFTDDPVATAPRFRS